MHYPDRHCIDSLDYVNTCKHGFPD